MVKKVAQNFAGKRSVATMKKQRTNAGYQK
jgi:hypothetical protein